MAELTVLLRAAQDRDPDAVKRLFEIVYGDLKRLAHSNLRKSSGVQELNTTALVHESFVKYLEHGALAQTDRPAFFAYVGRVMRNVVIDYVREPFALRILQVGAENGAFPNPSQENVNIRQPGARFFHTAATPAVPIVMHGRRMTRLGAVTTGPSRRGEPEPPGTSVMEKTIMSKTLESPVSSTRLAAGAKAAIVMVARGFSALVDEHSLALHAATKAALPRRRLTELRAIYTAPNAKRRSTAAKDNFIRAFESRAVVRGFVMGFNVVALVIALGLIALVAI